MRNRVLSLWLKSRRLLVPNLQIGNTLARETYIATFVSISVSGVVETEFGDEIKYTKVTNVTIYN